MFSEEFVCDDCDRRKPRFGSFKMVREDKSDLSRDGEIHFVCAQCAVKYNIRKPLNAS